MRKVEIDREREREREKEKYREKGRREGRYTILVCTKIKTDILLMNYGSNLVY